MKNIVLGLALVATLIILVIKWQRPSIDGLWIADHVIDNESDTLNIDASVVQLNIDNDNYSFTSTLNTKEEGTIRKSGNHLIVDNKNSNPYRIDITHLTNSSLTLSMRVGDIPRRIIMKRHMQ